MKTSLSVGDTVVVYIQNPREKMWGYLCALTPAGVTVSGIDLSAFEDWVRGLVSGDTAGLGLTTTFIPMWRIERMILDCAAAGVPGLEDQMIARTGFSLKQFVEQADDFSSEPTETDDFDQRQN